jgi:hypothetical protein
MGAAGRFTAQNDGVPARADVHVFEGVCPYATSADEHCLSRGSTTGKFTVLLHLGCIRKI